MPDGQSKSGGNGRGHIPDRELVLFLDGELTSPAADGIERHLQTCWTCRSRSERIQKSISGFAEFRREQINAAPPKQWREFRTRLEMADGEEEQEQAWSGFLPFAWFRGAWMRPAWVVLAGVLGFLLFLQFAGAPLVQAKELLRLAGVAETGLLEKIKDPVFYQKLIVRRGSANSGETVEVWHDTGEGILRFEGDEELGGEIRRILEVNRLERYPLLSAAGFRSWRSKVRIGEETVDYAGGDRDSDLLSLAVSAAADMPLWSIEKAVLIVRQEAWLPVGVEWYVRAPEGLRRYEIEQVRTRVVARAEWGRKLGTGALPAPPAVSPAPAPQLPISAGVTVSRPSAREILALELRALYALHRKGTCLTGAVRVERPKPDLVAVEGMTENSIERQELVLALPDSPHLAIKVRSVDEMLAEAPPMDESASPPGTPPARAPRKPLLEGHVREYFKGLHPERNVSADVTQYLDDVVTISQSIRRESWALRRLAERYAGPEFSGAPAATRLMLETMIRDHVTQLTDLSAKHQTLLAPLLNSFPAPAPGALTDLEAAAAMDTTPWARRSLSLTAYAEFVDDTVMGLFAGGASSDADAARDPGRLLAALDRLHGASTGLEAAIGMDFLAAPSLAASGQK